MTLKAAGNGSGGLSMRSGVRDRSLLFQPLKNRMLYFVQMIG